MPRSSALSPSFRPCTDSATWSALCQKRPLRPQTCGRDLRIVVSDAYRAAEAKPATTFGTSPGEELTCLQLYSVDSHSAELSPSGSAATI